MPSPLVAVVGSANVDYVARVASLPRPGDTVLGGDLLTLMGGKGANQAAAAATLGATVRFVGAVGNDAAGAAVRANLTARGVDVSRLATSTTATGTALITVDDAGENVIVVSAGANADVGVCAADVAGCTVALAQLEIPTATVEALLDTGVPVILNVAPPRVLPEGILARCAVVIANEAEAAAVDCERAPVLVVTKGAAGAVLYVDGLLVDAVAPPAVTPVDTVGAGDAFCAAFATQFAQGRDLHEALRYAVIAGSLATLAPGAQGALPTDQEVRTWLARA